MYKHRLSIDRFLCFGVSCAGVALSSLAKSFGEGLTIQSPPVFGFVFVFLSGDQLAHASFTSSFFSVRISPQKLSKLRRLWLSVS